MINKNPLNWLRDDCGGGVCLVFFLEVYSIKELQDLLGSDRVMLLHPQFRREACRLASRNCVTDTEYLKDLIPDPSWDVHCIDFDGKPSKSTRFSYQVF